MDNNKKFLDALMKTLVNGNVSKIKVSAKKKTAEDGYEDIELKDSDKGSVKGISSKNKEMSAEERRDFRKNVLTQLNEQAKKKEGPFAKPTADASNAKKEEMSKAQTEASKAHVETIKANFEDLLNDFKTIREENEKMEKDFAKSEKQINEIMTKKLKEKEDEMQSQIRMLENNKNIPAEEKNKKMKSIEGSYNANKKRIEKEYKDELKEIESSYKRTTKGKPTSAAAGVKSELESKATKNLETKIKRLEDRLNKAKSIVSTKDLGKINYYEKNIADIKNKIETFKKESETQNKIERDIIKGDISQQKGLQKEVRKDLDKASLSMYKKTMPRTAIGQTILSVATVLSNITSIVTNIVKQWNDRTKVIDKVLKIGIESIPSIGFIIHDAILLLENTGLKKSKRFFFVENETLRAVQVYADIAVSALGTAYGATTSAINIANMMEKKAAAGFNDPSMI